MMNRLQIPADLREKINRELVPGEVILWIDQPIRRVFRPAEGIFILRLPWIGFGLFLIWGIFVLIDLYYSFMAKKDALKTAYIITDRRAISFEVHWPMTTIRSYLPNQIQNVYRQNEKDGQGDIILTIYYKSDGEGGERKEFVRFGDIRDPKGAEQLLKELAHINI